MGASSPRRFRKPFHLLGDDQVTELAHALGGFLLHYQRDLVRWKDGQQDLQRAR